MKRRIALALLLAAGALSCQRWNLTSRDLVGTWTLADSSRHLLPAEVRSVSAQVVLNEDGSFRASAFPVEPDYFKGETSYQTFTGEGIWKLSVEQGDQVVDIVFQRIEGVGAVDNGVTLKVSEAWTPGTPIRLFFWEGDPDLARRIEFERR